MPLTGEQREHPLLVQHAEDFLPSHQFRKQHMDRISSELREHGDHTTPHTHTHQIITDRVDRLYKYITRNSTAYHNHSHDSYDTSLTACQSQRF